MSSDPPFKNSAQNTMVFLKALSDQVFSTVVSLQSDRRISTAGIHTGIIKIKLFKSRNRTLSSTLWIR